jgi:hypothetical protein
MQAKALATIGVLSLVLAACDPSNAIHVEAGFRADSLLFHAFQRPDSLRGADILSTIEVSLCDSLGWFVRPVWQLSRDRGGFWSRHPSPVYFRYGAESTPGWVTSRHAEPLRPGLYGATAEGGGIGGLQRFFVDSTGHVTIAGDSFPKRQSRK